MNGSSVQDGIRDEESNEWLMVQCVCLMDMDNLGLRQEHSWHLILMRPVNLASEVKAICFVGTNLELILNFSNSDLKL